MKEKAMQPEIAGKCFEMKRTARVSALALSSGIMSDDCWVPQPVVAVELGVTDRTLWRWRNDLNVAFPQPKIIRGRCYFRRSELDAWKATRETK